MAEKTKEAEVEEHIRKWAMRFLGAAKFPIVVDAYVRGYMDRYRESCPHCRGEV